MLVVGLTGGIGSGKSAAAELFAQHGVNIIDTDIIAHGLTRAGQPALRAIADEFGSEYLAGDGTLDRAALRERVFTDPNAKKSLENILHPLIREAVVAELMLPNSAPYRIVVVPLLFETGAYRDIVQRSLVIDCPEPIQLQRAMARSGLPETEVRSVMAAQLSRAERISLADDVIINDADLKTLAEKIGAIHKKYLRLA